MHWIFFLSVITAAPSAFIDRLPSKLLEREIMSHLSFREAYMLMSLLHLNPLKLSEMNPIANHNADLEMARRKKDWGKYLKFMVMNPSIRLNFGRNLACMDAVQNGYIETLERLLKLPKRMGVNPSDNYNMALIVAINNHHLDVVDILLKYGVDPSYFNNVPFISACDSANPAVVKRLLDDARVNPSVNGNFAFIKACEKGWFDILQILLKRINLETLNASTKQIAFQGAAENGHFEILELLLSLPREAGINPSADDNYALKKGAENGHVDVLNLLLSLPKEAGINPSIDNNFPFRKAAENGHYEIVNLLLSLPKEYGIDPSAQVNYALRYSTRNGHFQIAKKLLSLPLEAGIDISSDNYYVVRTLCWNDPLRWELEKNSSYIQDEDKQMERLEFAQILLSRVPHKNVDRNLYMECVRSSKGITLAEMSNILIE